MANITVVGAGYVGLVTGACFADMGNHVVCLDIDEAKIQRLRMGELPIYEPGLENLVSQNMAAGRLLATSSYAEALAAAELVFIAVNTPSGREGEADMRDVHLAAKAIGQHLRAPAIIVNKSTMPIGAGDWVAQIISRNAGPDATGTAVVSNPEFLREGSAVHDFTHPDRIVLGATDRAAAERVATLYAPFDVPVLITDLRTAEMVKYASNAFLATKISFVNEIASICDRLGADVKEVARGMGLDRRIGPSFLDAGIGFGGSCFPKDVKALEYMAAVNGCHPQLLRAVIDINRDVRRSVVQKVRSVLGGLDGKTVGVLGLAFKPNTDDLREAPSLDIIHHLKTEGAHVKAYDPAACEKAAALLPGVELCASAYAATEGAHVVILVTEWNEFKQLDLARVRRTMATPLLIDGRNVYDPRQMKDLGFRYFGIGRGITDGSAADAQTAFPGVAVQRDVPPGQLTPNGHEIALTA